MIKSRKLAYDGRGNAVAKSEEELPSAINGNYFLAGAFSFYHVDRRVLSSFTLIEENESDGKVIF